MFKKDILKNKVILITGGGIIPQEDMDTLKEYSKFTIIIPH